MKRVAVIGAGASGIMAAIFAAKNGNKVTLFEKQKKIGRKIGISGNGRCNISNSRLDVTHYHGHYPKFVYNLFSRFGLNETISFFSSIGIPIKEEKRGRLYPFSLQAATVVDFLEHELFKHNVELFLHRRIDKIEKDNNGFTLETAGKEQYFFDSVILAAGGAAYQQLGGSMQGYELAAKQGHHIYQPIPIILPLNIPLKALHRLEGIKWDCAVKVVNKKKVLAASKGELLFTKYGISGPATLEISRWVNEAVIKGESPLVVLDLFPGLDESELKKFISQLLVDNRKTIAFALEGVLKKRVPEVILQIAGIDSSKKATKLDSREFNCLISSLKNLELKPGEPRPLKDAVSTAGGVDVKEIDPLTMESKKVSGLYITGELLDIDGDCGGYNLQFAWSTGALAGMAQ